jgi:PAS domain S-box-containing protein
MNPESRLRVLVVDDSEDDALLLVRALERNGFELVWNRVYKAQDMRDALQDRRYDLILSDYYMPAFGAHEALEIAQEIEPDLPFIVISGAVGEEKAVDIMLAGAHDFVMKQNLARLVPVIQRELREAQVRRERRRDVEQLQLQAAALETAANGIMITDRDGVVEWVNQAFCDQTGYRLGELAGRHSRILRSPEQEEQIYQDLWTTILAGRIWRGELINRRKGGSHYFAEQTVAPVRGKDGGISHFIAIQQDITERKRAEAEREELQRQLQQAQKMEALGQLTGGIAHDFNNILGAIIGYTDLAIERFAPDGEGKLAEYLKQVYRAAIRARDLIAQMLAYSRSGGVSEESIHLGPVIQEVIKMLRSALPATLEIETTMASDLPQVRLDPVQLHQVVMNLCINGRDAMDGHGRLRLHLDWTEGVRALCSSCHHAVEGDYVRLTLEDDGPGIAPEILNRIFEPFFTTKEVGRGTGMGLSVVHGIVHDHGGHILVENRPEGGTRFELLLPASDLPQAGGESRGQGAGGPIRRGHGHILVVDDEPRLVHYFAELLESQGYRVTGITDAREALQRFIQSPEKVDLVITDQTMPEMTGAELARKMLGVRPSLPVILCTGYSAEIDAESARAIHVAGYFEKPVLPEDLIRRVGELLS